MSTIENDTEHPEWHTIVAAPEPARQRRWLIPVLAGAAVLLSTGAGVAATRHDPGMVAPLVHARQAHSAALAAKAKAKAAAKAEKWAHDMHNPAVLEASVQEEYESSIADTDDPSGSIDSVTCRVKDRSNPDMFSCLITASSVYEDEVTAAHDVLVSDDGTTWQTTS